MLIIVQAHITKGYPEITPKTGRIKLNTKEHIRSLKGTVHTKQQIMYILFTNDNFQCYYMMKTLDCDI